MSPCLLPADILSVTLLPVGLALMAGVSPWLRARQDARSASEQGSFFRTARLRCMRCLAQLCSV
ncbi:hypothetical protein BO71DRAFT_221203 [Aspergillus ellipticus CBS 707.79]|uniref:Uncharacterized protein n=1 Tax=Aspergillus ellipticus CBS 707.79 TaxID=1448320 RepID=A0A319DSA0_9EURO|nr:hypothetical protein BO71DRAFT_221203 [Aspergillus ellipticus CBS 707.79]